MIEPVGVFQRCEQRRLARAGISDQHRDAVFVL